MATSDGSANTPGTSERAQESKPKRVRTGCLTCRERHLKCDEGWPNCQNCRKSNRTCKYGVKLNFIDIQVHQPSITCPTTGEYQVAFLDESREVASEYKGGRAKYPQPMNHSTDHNSYYPTQLQSAPTAHQPLPPIQGILPEPYQNDSQNMGYEQQPGPSHHHSHSQSESNYSGSNIHGTVSETYIQCYTFVSEQHLGKEYLDTQEEVLFMQVFVEEVGLWMDSMDPMKHFSRLIPFHALSEPMLLNPLLACGARHLSLVNQKYSEEKALHYYDTATRYLLNQLQNPNRDTVICATAAVILNVYEIMCERALQRMNHIAGARALIKECGWNARSTGIGGACFWLNVGMELLSCLHFNWQVAWDPDDWGLDMDMKREQENNKEEMWTHRILYIVGKVCNFRASIPRTQDPSSRAEQIRVQRRFEEWAKLKELADTWNDCIPRTMHPMAYLYPGQTLSGSAFPEVWLIKRTSIVARLFYHTCMCLLAQINPLQGPDHPTMAEMLQRHAQFICGISAHVKDRGVASVALRSLAIAAEVLTTRREQEEVLQIFDKIRQETGWRVGFLNTELKEKWGWNNEPQHHDSNVTVLQNGNMSYQHQAMQAQVNLQPVQPPTTLPTAPPAQVSRRPASGIMNPLLSSADFNMPQHPYQQHYVAPNPIYQSSSSLSQQYYQ
ncbi:hypothetical protein CC78DRAFT_460546 [Lojkania enalia]|uniref:Zn(2)-C6 fungal-type domain-containing protein n=1 Tax=Lojkania enalia TaxID=147567 RepID=A0A9P4N8P3_9PLEO|nr:hypothetical protein CC78DRAFT_460546 [Didymosphaeria enalia]